MQTTKRTVPRRNSRDNSADRSSAGTATSDTSASLSDMATTSSAGHIEIETIGSVDDDIDPETPDDECHTATAATAPGGTKSDENEDLVTSGDESELDPLQSNMSKGADNDKDAASQNACLEMGDDETWSKDFDRDSQSPTSRKKGWDVRCFVIGFLVLLLVAGGASVIVLAQRFKGETIYDFHFASYYGDHMVLQRAPHRAVIWGYGPIIVVDNTSVLVVLEGPEGPRQEYRTTVGKTNAGLVWRVLVGPISHRGPYVITASLEDVEGYKIELKDVLFGDIWVCVEQNKIHLSVSKLMNGTEEGQDFTQSHRYQDIRIFSLFPAKSDMLWYDLRGIQLPWTVPKSVMDVRISQSHANLHFPGICWLFGKQLHERLQYPPIGLVSVTYSDSIMEEWVPSRVNEKCGIAYSDSSSRIWNGMIHPMLDMQVFGLIWHQGDLDAHEVLNNYDCALVEFVRHWRQEAFDRAGGSSDILLPVGIIQLTAKSVSSPYTYGYSGIRWKQTANYGYLPNDQMPATFLAVTIDLPEPISNHTSLHAGHKHDIVSRLVHGALSVAYKRGHVRMEPFPDKYSAWKGSLTLTFKPPRITIRNINGFEICCSKNLTEYCPIRNSDFDNQLEWLSAPIVDSKSNSTSVTVASAACKDHIVAVRYAWREAPCSVKNCAIYGADVNPMPPYIRYNLTDDGVTRPLGMDQVPIL